LFFSLRDRAFSASRGAQLFLLGVLAVHCGSAKQHDGDDDSLGGGQSGAVGSGAPSDTGGAADSVCAPRSKHACSGANGCNGERLCKADGSGYGSCVCSDASGVAGQSDGAAGESAAAGAANGGAGGSTGGTGGSKGGKGGTSGRAGSGRGGTGGASRTGGAGGTSSGVGGTPNGASGTGGAGGTSSGMGGSAGRGGASNAGVGGSATADPFAGCTMAPVAPIATTTLIDNFEDDDTYAQGYGAWYSFDDGTAEPGDEATLTLSTLTRAAGNQYSLDLRTGVHTGYGSGFGVILADNAGTQDTFDATSYDGFEFWARATGPGALRVNFPDKNSDPQGGVCSQAGGTCNHYWGVDLNLDTTWRRYRVHFDEVYTQGNVNEPFVPTALYRAEFEIGPNTSLEFFVDDAQFFRTADSAYAVDGRVFQRARTEHRFHGLDRPSLEWDPHGEELSLADLQRMAGWGADTVRISLNQDFWLSESPAYDAGYASLVDKVVACAHTANLDVILDLHWSDRGDYSVTPGQQQMADAHSVEFWQELATRYKNNSRVLFELYNEPHDVSWDVWRDGGGATGFTAVGFQALYDAVRATGAENVVLAGGLSYAFDLSGVPAHRLRGFNIGYVTHPYNFSGKQPSDWPTAFGTVATYYPVIATEFGDTTSCSASYSQSFIDYAASLGISWTAWAWWVEPTNPCAFPTLISDWDGTPTIAGAAVKAALMP
jgi:hypothetical protein